MRPASSSSVCPCLFTDKGVGEGGMHSQRGKHCKLAQARCLLYCANPATKAMRCTVLWCLYWLEVQGFTGIRILVRLSLCMRPSFYAVGKRSKLWTTFNEPGVQAMCGYIVGKPLPFAHQSLLPFAVDGVLLTSANHLEWWGMPLYQWGRSPVLICLKCLYLHFCRQPSSWEDPSLQGAPLLKTGHRCHSIVMCLLCIACSQAVKRLP